MFSNSKLNEKLKGPSGRKIIVSIGLCAIILVSFFAGYFTRHSIRGETVQVVSDIVEIMDKVGYIYDPEIDDYVKLETDKVARLIAGNFLDGYSAYYTKEEYEKLVQENSGRYLGIGVSFSATELENSNQILKVSLNSPAFNAGIKDGDQVVGVKKVIANATEEQEYTPIENGKQLSDFMKAVVENQKVSLKIIRDSEELFFEVIKSEYYMCYVTYTDSEQKAYFSPDGNTEGESVENVGDSIKEHPYDSGNAQLGDDVAIITLSAFEGDAGYQIGAVIKYMISRGRTSLILDLCGNGGGDMRVLTEVASHLIYNQGKNDYKIVSANEKLDGDGAETEEGYRVSHFSVENNNFNLGVEKITVMADRYTASASECLIGAMIHYSKSSNPEQEDGKKEPFSKDNLVIVSSLDSAGQTVYRTYGKGIMQTTYRLQSGGALKLTTAKITWPDGKTCIHKVGIKPSLSQNGVLDKQSAIDRAIEIASQLEKD